MRIDLVCRVVDNFGDIAVTWRLARSLLRAGGSTVSIRLLVDHWETFHALVPEVPASGVLCRVASPEGEVTVIHSANLEQLEHERLQPADVIVEAFGAPTPVVWLEPFLAAAERDADRNRSRIILHLEYLTAEGWTEDYHLVPSPVGRPGVERWFFVPGFRAATGGLIFPGTPARRWDRGPEDWLISLFSYEHNFGRFWSDLGTFLEQRRQTAKVLVFAGRSRDGAWSTWLQYQSTFPERASRILVVDQAFVSIDDYAALLGSCDFNVVRGEASWVEALLSGRPFLWHAYLQDDGYQRVKVEAFLEVWKPWFDQEGPDAQAIWPSVRNAFLEFNTRTANRVDDEPGEGYRVFWENADLIARVLRNWADWLKKNADLGGKMLEFLESFRL